MRHSWTRLFASMVVAACLGCRDAQPPATVSGIVWLDDHPLDRCVVTFLPEAGSSGGVYSSGVTDAQGRFVLRYADQRVGASVGRHRVTFHDLGLPAAQTGEDVDPGAPEPARPPRFSAVYLSEKDTPLRYELQPGEQQIELRLPSAAPRRSG